MPPWETKNNNSTSTFTQISQAISFRSSSKFVIFLSAMSFFAVNCSSYGGSAPPCSFSRLFHCVLCCPVRQSLLSSLEAESLLRNLRRYLRAETKVIIIAILIKTLLRCFDSNTMGWTRRQQVDSETFIGRRFWCLSVWNNVAMLHCRLDTLTATKVHRTSQNKSDTCLGHVIRSCYF